MTTSSSASAITGPLMLGSRGKDVQTLQSLLNQANGLGSSLAEDSIFGIKTDAAVRAFQRWKGLQADGIVGPKTAQALGATYVHQPRPAPKSGPPGTAPTPATVTPEAVLIGTVVQELKRIETHLEETFDNGYDERPEVYDQSRKYLKSTFVQAYFILSTAAHGGLSADFVAGQIRVAILLIVGGLSATAQRLTAGGADPSEVLSTSVELNATAPQVADVVRSTLQGQLEGGLSAGRKNIQSLLDPLT